MTITLNGSTGITDADGGTVLNTNDIGTTAGTVPALGAGGVLDAARVNYGGLSTPVTAAGQSAIDFTTGIPAGVTEVTVHFMGLSLSGSDDPLVQVGNSGGFVTAGYASASTNSFNAVVATTSSTAGMIIYTAAAARFLDGHVTLKRASSGKWTASGNMGVGGGSGPTASSVGGSVPMSGDLTQIRITRTGTNTFDAGSVNISWRF